MVHYKRVVSRSFDLAPGILRFSAARFRTQVKNDPRIFKFS